MLKPKDQTSEYFTFPGKQITEMGACKHSYGNPKMKVLILLYDDYPFGGCQWSAYAAADSLRKSNIDAYVLCIHRHKDTVQPLANTIYLLSRHPSNNLEYLTLIAKEFKKLHNALKPSLIISFNLRIGAYIALLGPKDTKLAYSERIYPGMYGGFVAHILDGIARRIYACKGAHIICQTKPAKDWYCRVRLHEASKVHIIPNIIRAHAYNKKSSRVLTKTRNAPCKILCVGRLTLQKGYDRALIILAETIRLGLDPMLYIIGEGPEEQPLFRLAARLNCMERLCIIAPTTPDEIEWQDYDVYLHTARYEGFPNTLGEAMSNRIPCVALNCMAGPSDLIRDGIDGYLVDQGDLKLAATRILDLYKNKNLSRLLCDSAYEKIQHNSVDVISVLWEQAVMSCLSIQVAKSI